MKNLDISNVYMLEMVEILRSYLAQNDNNVVGSDLR